VFHFRPDPLLTDHDDKVLTVYLDPLCHAQSVKNVKTGVSAPAWFDP
jgi:hypothetical protein